MSIQTYSSNQCNDQFPQEIVSWSNNVCVQYFRDSFTVFCYGGRITIVYFVNTPVSLAVRVHPLRMLTFSCPLDRVLLFVCVC